MLALQAQGYNPTQITKRLHEMGHNVHRRTVCRWLDKSSAEPSPTVRSGQALARALRRSRDVDGPASRWLAHLERTLEDLHRMAQEDSATGLAAAQTAGELALAAAELAADLVEETASAGIHATTE